VSSVLSSALTNQAAGLAAISNHQALLRVTAQLKAAAVSAANSLSPAQIAQLQSTPPRCSPAPAPAPRQIGSSAVIGAISIKFGIRDGSQAKR
jgi:hypothetical protein